MKEQKLAQLFVKIAFYAIIINSLGQLAISQYHIKAIVQVRNRPIGFFLFCFIIIGLVTLFNVTRLSKRSNLIVTGLASILTSAFGIIYLYLALTDEFSSSSVVQSVIIMAFGVLLYLGSAVLLIIAGIKNPYQKTL